MIVVVIGKLDVTLAGRRQFPFFEVAEWWRELTGPPRKGFGLFWESAQPEEDRTEAWIHSPERESPSVEAEEEG